MSEIWDFIFTEQFILGLIVGIMGTLVFLMWITWPSKESRGR